jgi:hypothetical protein
MRNEIFEKIKQNRIRSLTELNNIEKKELNKKESIEDTNRNKTEVRRRKRNPLLPVSAFWNNRSFPKISIDTTETVRSINRYGRLSKSAFNKLIMGITPLFSSLNRKVNSTADKMTEGFYSYSSRFFEDRYEYVDVNDYQGVKTIAIIPAIAYEEEYNVLNESITFFNEVWAKLAKTRLVRSMVLFFEFDENISIESQDQKHIAVSEKSIYARPEIQRTLTNTINIIDRHTKILVIRLNKLQGYFKTIAVNKTDIILKVKPTVIRLKQRLFPAINRFVRY